MRCRIHACCAVLVVACGGPAPECAIDGGCAIDAGHAIDAGAPVDSSAPIDAFVRVDAFVPIDAGPPEVCTPSVRGAVPADEDLDGEVDEDCSWHFGVPHFVNFAQDSVGTRTERIRLAQGGTALWLSGYHGDPSVAPYSRVGRRASTLAPFLPRAVGTSQIDSVVQVTEDELGALDWNGSAVTIRRRSSSSDPFGAPETLLAAGGSDPFLSRDGLELWLVTDRGVERATRATTSDAFGALEATSIAVGATPMISDDGHTLFFQRDDPGGGLPRHVFRAHRADRGVTFDEPELVSLPMPDGGWDRFGSPFYSQATRELFFTNGPYQTNEVLRVEVCRDGPCPARTVDCASPGALSTDGVHCFEIHESPLDYDGAIAACASASADGTALGYLASVDTYTPDLAFVWGRFSSVGTFWIGYDDRATEGVNVSASGEPPAIPIGPSWSSGNVPITDDCAVLTGSGRADDTTCSLPYPYLCERELWPTW